MPRLRSIAVAAVVAVAFLALAPGASAEDEGCACNCYFGADCESGDFCDWGSSFMIEDGCWWRTPKPIGNPGAGCNQNYDSFGRCDGKCAPLGAAAQSIVGGEPRGALGLGVSMWAAALTEASLAGGRVPSRVWLERIDGIAFHNPTMSHGLWRMVAEALLLARGGDYIVFPPHDSFTLAEVAVADLRGRDGVRRNGDRVIAALLAELESPGAGRVIVASVDAALLDVELLGRVCKGGDVVACLHRRIADMAAVLRLGSDPAAGQPSGLALGDVQPPCPGCSGDIVASDGIDFDDLLELLAHWGSTAYPAGDFNHNGTVEFQDLVQMLASWGPCA